MCASFPIFLMGLMAVCEFFNIFNPGYEVIVWPFGIIFLFIFWGLYLILPEQVSALITYQKTEGFIQGAFPNKIGFVVTLIICMVPPVWDW